MSILVSLIKDIFGRNRSPDEMRALKHLEVSLIEQGHWDEAEAQYQKMLELNPNNIDALFNLGLVYDMQRQKNEAIECYRKILATDSKYFAAKIHIVHWMQQQCQWDGLKSDAQKLRKAVLEAPIINRNHIPPFAFMALPGATAMEIKRCAERYVQIAYRSLARLRPSLGFDFKRPPGNKIRVGYLSGDLRQHAVSYLMAEVFELHDRSQFHISAYSYGPDDASAMRNRLEKAFDRFVDIRDDSYESAARKIYADRIDILVDLTGYTRDSRCGILALRPAPVQVNYLGYPGTMGADFIDYIIADEFVVPPGREKYYTESVMRLPDCFQANDSARPRLKAPTRTECGLPEESVVFCCFNQTLKITPEFFDIWCRLLKAVPGSVLWLSTGIPQAEANLRKEAESRGVAPERLIVAPFLQRDQYLARLQCADLFLDTLPYNAGTTCSDALWMGLPVVTCAGDFFASRMAGSLLTAIGVPELIAYNLEEYYRLALELATDREKLDAIRSKIVANRDTTPLFDSKRFTRNLEHAYRQMMEECSARSRTDG